MEKKRPCRVLTHKGRYQEVTGWHKRLVNEEIVEVSPLYLPFDLKLTSNHEIYAISKEQVRRCTRRGGWVYRCKPDRISKFLDCQSCKRQYFRDYGVSLVAAGNLKKGDFLAIPIDRRVENIEFLGVEEVLEREPTFLETQKKISEERIREILRLNAEGCSQWAISRKLRMDRGTVNRYILLEKEGSLGEVRNPLTYREDGMSFKGGLRKIPPKISLDEDFLFLVGLYLAEGHVSYHRDRPNSATLGWTFGKTEMGLIEDTKRVFGEVFGNQLSSTLNTINNTCQLYIGATIAAKLFKILFGGDCYRKKIP
ncbi:hypothetical protein L6258_03310, partial [Candidatus Parcubacteria bacterium]|nr:hypothetical protein [Candidatus Parcubacteria bacterium]